MPKDALLGDPEIKAKGGFAGVMQTFDNTRPLVAAMAVGVARAALDHTRDALAEAGVEIDPDAPAVRAARGGGRAARHGGRLRGRAAADAAGVLDGRQQEAELAAGLDGQGEGRAAWAPTCACAASRCAARRAIGETELLEKWARDAKILDIFEGTQQIQLLIIARQLLKKTSAELK